nr:hypothetical protein [uncultured Desulfobulbus sp.]
MIIRSLSVILFWVVCQVTPAAEAGTALCNANYSGTPQMSTFPQGVEVRYDPRNGTIVWVKGKDLGTELKYLQEIEGRAAGMDAVEVALTYICAYRTLFHLRCPRTELSVKRSWKDTLGMDHVHFTQQWAGVPVEPAELSVHFDRNGQITAIHGHYLPTPAQIDTVPELTPKQAVEIVAHVLGVDSGILTGCRVELVFFNTGTKAQLAYRVYAEKSLVDAQVIVIDAFEGTVLDRTSALQTKGPSLQHMGDSIQLR